MRRRKGPGPSQPAISADQAPVRPSGFEKWDPANPHGPHGLESMNSLRVRRLMIWAMSRIHRALYRASRGRAGSRIQGPVLLLTTVGRKTGRPRTTPLFYLNQGAGWAVIGSYGGDPRHPQWWLNLRANPNAAVQIRSATTPVRSREASGEERDRLWLGFVTMFPGYLRYERRTGRRFPITVLEPMG